MSSLVELVEGDCLKMMEDIPNNSVDLVLTDPPYGTTKCKWDIVIPLSPMWQQLKRITKSNSAILIFGTEPFSSLLRTSNLTDYKYDWVWDKPNGTGYLNAKIQPIRSHEVISVFYRKQPTYNPIKTTGHSRKVATRRKNTTEVYGSHKQEQHYDSTERYPRSVQSFSSDKQTSNLHPSQKPLALISYLIKTYTNEEDTVLDFAMGSGTTGVACINTNRNFIGIELDPNFYAIACDRIENA